MIYVLGGGANLNFKVVGGTTEPASLKENTIWVNTDQKITSWHFGAEEPNVYELQNEIRTDNGQVDPRSHLAPHKLTEGNIINFVVPYTITDSMEWLAIVDTSDNSQRYCIRNADHTLLTTWEKGAKVSVKISNDETSFDIHKFRTAYIVSYGSYYHEEGTVWFSTYTTSSLAFNALKKNNVTVYPNLTKQYVNGAWVNKTVKIYQNGALADLIPIGTIFDTNYGGIVDPISVAYQQANASVTISSQGITYAYSSTGNAQSGVISDELYDLTDFNTLVVEATISGVGASKYEGRMGVAKSKWVVDKFTFAAQKYFTANNTRTVYELDISALGGEHYVGTAGGLNGVIHKIQLI